MLSVILPTINEAENLRKLLPLLKPLAAEIIIVDDASQDDTVAVAKSFGCTVIERQRKMGCGSAIYEAVKIARHDVVATMDADFSHDPHMLACASMIENDMVDVIKFSRFMPGGGMEDSKRLFGIRVYNKMIGAVLGVRIADITGGFVLAKKSCFDHALTGNTDWMLGFMRMNRCKKIAEVPFFYATRTVGYSKNTDLARIVAYFLQAVRLRFIIR